ncbi:protein FAM161A isoform X2 [Rhea pennata]|uniref:protein FAM161A isoform X2 n=1 Tax=Rhea pennata TaxID=8795 RepID=UPI002E26050F
MCDSNQEYYLKLEELKNAHLETMAKLESMYRNKLRLKGVQSLDKKDAASNIRYRSTWQKSSYQPLNLHRSFSESDLNDPVGSSISDESDRELVFEENDSETGSSSFAKQQIEKMWDGFSVEVYIPRTKHSLPGSPAFRTTRKNQKAWSPKVTVPKPFQMTIREARKKDQNVKSKSQLEMEKNLLKKQLEEEAECQKKFRANPVPASVFLPLYHEIVEQNEERRKSVKERSKLRLLASQKPFKFIEREKQKNEIRKMQLKDLSAPEKKTKLFKAKPVPKCVYSPAVNDKLKEEELYREIRIKMRAEELLRNSSLPSSRLAIKDINRKKKHKCIEPKETEHKPKIKSNVPDFEILHQKFQKQLLQQKQVKHITVCEPFDLRTPYIPSNKGKILKDIQEDEEKLKETRWPYASPRCKPQMRHSSANSLLLGSGDSKSPKITESTKRRLQAIRNSLEEKRKLEEEQKRNRTKQKQRAKKLQKIITTRAEANDPHQSLAQMSKSKLKTFRLSKNEVKENKLFEEAADSSPRSEQSCKEELEEEEEKRKAVRAFTQDNHSSEEEEEARASLRVHQLCHAGEAGASPHSDQCCKEEEAKMGRLLDSRCEEDKDEDEHLEGSSSQSDHIGEQEKQGQSDPEAQGAFRYDDEEYENDSEEKTSDDEGD